MRIKSSSLAVCRIFLKKKNHFKRGDIHSFLYRNLLTTPIYNAMYEEASLEYLCAYIPLSYTAPPCQKAWCCSNHKTPFGVFFLIVKPLVLSFTSWLFLYFSYHVTSEQNISPEPEMVHWQWLNSKSRPGLTKCFARLDSVVYIYRLLDCLQWDRMSHIFVWLIIERKFVTNIFCKCSQHVGQLL